jgi:hypothetical protein
MIPLQHLFSFLSKRQYEFQMAWGVFGQAFTLLTFETFAMVFCDKFGITGYAALFMYAVVPIAGVIAVTYSGHKMVTTGYATKYANYGSNVNSDWVELINNVKTIQKQLKEIEERK